MPGSGDLRPVMVLQSYWRYLIANDRKKQELQFRELQQLKFQELQQRPSETATIESNVALLMLEWIFVDRPGQPEPRYTVQV